MKRIIIAFFISVITFSSCMEANDALSSCGVEDPLSDLEWLKSIHTAMSMNMSPAGGQIIQYTYNGESVFWIDQCFGCADNLIEVYNCSGEVLCQFGGIAGVNTCPDFEENATDRKELANFIIEK